MILYIFLNFDSDTNRLLRWATFFNIRVKIIQNIEDLPELSEFGIFITNNLYPEPQLFFNLISGKHYLYSDIHFKGPKLLKSFCITTNNLSELKNLLIGIPSNRMFHSNDIALEISKEENNIRAGMPILEHERCDLLEKMMRDYSNIYKQQKVVEYYYSHLWINACQNLLLSKGILYSDMTKILRDSSLFTSSVKRKKIEKIEKIEKVLKYIKEGIDLYECMTDNIQGYIFEMKVSKYLYSRNILTIPGKVIIEPDFIEEEFDSGVTVVSFYYDLGYNEKPSKDYYNSIEKFCQISHPLIFYGDIQTCQFVRDFRKKYIDFTKVIEIPLGGWELIQKYSKDFRDMNLSNGFKRSKKYSILTCTKFWAIENAIELNPFLTQKFAWLDSGSFRHKHIIPEELIGKSLFSNITFDKVNIPCSTISPGTTEDEFESGVENVVAICMWGIAKDWGYLLEKFKQLVITKFDQNKFFTEQVMLSRLVALYPELINPIIYGYNSSQFKNMLKIN